MFERGFRRVLGRCRSLCGLVPLSARGASGDENYGRGDEYGPPLCVAGFPFIAQGILLAVKIARVGPLRVRRNIGASFGKLSRVMRKMFLFALLAAAVVAASGCSESGTPAEPSAPEATSSSSGGGSGTTALSSIEAADGRAMEWNGDAELYAIASAAPRLDAAGNSPGWLYTYVSESAGAVATVSHEGGAVAMDPEQELPEADIEFLSESALPPAGELLDSSEALEDAGGVAAVLDEEPSAETAAGLDSVSGGEPVWRFSTLRGGERVEESVPAVSAGS